mmetsp:Transcript_2465/g.3237  ORF Transcript_2465/g.3237 Transcript_2465/m.3237 type:complete len:220 (+) Transcript_2465:86-745(+)
MLQTNSEKRASLIIRVVVGKENIGTIVNLLHLHISLLGKSINGSSLLLHTPALISTVGTTFDNFRNGPHASRFSHVKSAHGNLIGRQLISVEDTSRSYKTRVSVLVKPFATERGSFTTLNTLLRVTGLFDGLELFFLSGLVVGSGSETQCFPDRSNLGGSKVSLSNDGKVNIKSWKIEKTSNFFSFLFGTVKTVTKTILVQCLFQSNFRDDSIVFSGSP